MLKKLKRLLRPDEPAFRLPESQNIDREELGKIYARLFATADGQKVLTHLQGITLARACGPEASDGQIRYSEGQRALVASILRLIAGGR